MIIMGIPPQGFAMYERMLWVQRAHSNPPCFSYLMGETSKSTMKMAPYPRPYCVHKSKGA